MNQWDENIRELSSEEMDKREYFKEYDFDRPIKFNVEHVATLKSVADVFARSFSQRMSAALRSSVTFKLNGDRPIEQVPYAAEYLKNMKKDHYAYCFIDLGYDNAKSIVAEFDLALVLPINHALSGSGLALKVDEERGRLTAIEELVLDTWIHEKMFPDLEEAFQNIYEFKLRLEKIETDPQYLNKITRPSDMVAVLNFDVEIGIEENKKKTEEVFKIAIPYLAVEPIMGRLNSENANEYKIEDFDEGQVKTIKNHLENVTKKVEVELGKSMIDLKSLIDLRTNDVFLIDRFLGEDFIGYIAGKEKFKCKAGEENGKIAVKITEFALKEEEVNE